MEMEFSLRDNGDSGLEFVGSKMMMMREMDGFERDLDVQSIHLGD